MVYKPMSVSYTWLTLYRSNTFPYAMEPPLYQEQHPQAQQYYYRTVPQYPNQGNYSGGYLPPVQDLYDTSYR